jgi:hypothetical protein
MRNLRGAFIAMKCIEDPVLLSYYQETTAQAHVNRSNKVRKEAADRLLQGEENPIRFSYTRGHRLQYVVVSSLSFHISNDIGLFDENQMILVKFKIKKPFHSNYYATEA